VFIETRDDGGGGANWTTGVKSPSQIIATNKPTSSFLQAGCPSCRPTNSVKALKGIKALTFTLYLKKDFSYSQWSSVIPWLQ